LFSVPYLSTFGWMETSAPNYVPLGIASLAAVLRREGHDVVAIACDLSRISVAEGIKKLLSSMPDLIGISATTPGYPLACRVAGILKERTAAPICIGGNHVSARPRESLRECAAFDLVVAGEGEQPLLVLLELMAGRKPLAGSSSPAGIFWRDTGKILEGPPGAFLTDLDELPFPAYDLFDIRRCRPPVYFDFGLYPAINIMTSRGCPSRCCFCASKLTMGSRYRTFSPAYIYEMICYLKKDFGIRFISFTDDALTIRKQHITELCEKLQRSGMDLKWTCFSRADGMDRALAMEMAKAGCVGINFGIETGNAKTLSQIGKGSSLEDSALGVDAARQAGLRIVCSFITGFPGETPEMAEDTIQFAIKLNSDAAIFNTLVPYPGTPVSREALDPEYFNGIDWTMMRTSTSGAGPVFAGGGRTAADLVNWIRRANRIFYLRRDFFAKIPRLLPRNLNVALRYSFGLVGLAIKTILMKPAARIMARHC
jgi:anaerobic magnesium-protoporphyrin IX monomethyl ester cyclase